MTYSIHFLKMIFDLRWSPPRVASHSLWSFTDFFVYNLILVILQKPEIVEILYSKEHCLFFTMLFVSFQAKLLWTIYFINFVTTLLPSDSLLYSTVWRVAANYFSQVFFLFSSYCIKMPPKCTEGLFWTASNLYAFSRFVTSLSWLSHKL